MTKIPFTIITLCVALLSAFAASAQDPAQAATKAASPFHWGRVRFDLQETVADKWDAHPWADTYFLNTLKKCTNINVDVSWREVSLDKIDEMCKFPMLFITAEGAFEFTELHKKNLKEYIARGGFLYADDCVISSTGDHFFKSFRSQMEQLFNKKMERLPNDHPLYHCLYDLDGAPFMQGQNHGGHALFSGKRISIFLTPGDIHCGWASSYKRSQGQGAWFPQKEKEEKAIQMGINMIVYAMSN